MTNKISFLLLLLHCSFAGISQKKSLTLTITYTEPYCGGARPTKEIEEATQTPKPYAKKTVVIVSESGKLCVVKTNSAGVLKVKLKEGSYKVYESWRYYKQAPAPNQLKDMDSECLKSEWQKEIYTIKIGPQGNEVVSKNEIVIYCPWAVPCLLESAKPQMPE